MKLFKKSLLLCTTFLLGMQATWGMNQEDLESKKTPLKTKSSSRKEMRSTSRVEQERFSNIYGFEPPLKVFDQISDEGSEPYKIQSLSNLIKILEAVPDLFRPSRNPSSWHLESLANDQLMLISNLSSDYIVFSKNPKQWGGELLSSIEDGLSKSFPQLVKATGMRSNTLRCFNFSFYDKGELVLQDFRKNILQICDEDKEALIALRELTDKIMQNSRADLNLDLLTKITPFRDLYGKYYDEEILKHVKQNCNELKGNYPWLVSGEMTNNALSTFQRLEILYHICNLGETIKGFSPSIIKKLFDDYPWSPQRLRDVMAHSSSLLDMIFTNHDSQHDPIYYNAIKDLYDLKNINIENPSLLNLEGLKNLGVMLKGDNVIQAFPQDPYLTYPVFKKSAKDIKAYLQENLFNNCNKDKGKPDFHLKDDWGNALPEFINFLRSAIEGNSPKLAHLDEVRMKYMLESFLSNPNRFFTNTFDKFINTFDIRWDDFGADSRRKEAWNALAKVSYDDLSVSDAYQRFKKNLLENHIIVDGADLPETYNWGLSSKESPYIGIFHRILAIPDTLEERQQMRLNNIKNLINKMDKIQELIELSSQKSSPLTFESIIESNLSDKDSLSIDCWKIIHKRNIKESWRCNSNLSSIRHDILTFAQEKNSAKGLFVLTGFFYEQIVKILDYPELAAILKEDQVKEVRNSFFHQNFLERDHLQFSFEEGVYPKTFFRSFKDIVADELSILLINIRFLLKETLLAYV